MRGREPSVTSGAACSGPADSGPAFVVDVIVSLTLVAHRRAAKTVWDAVFVRKR